MTGSTTGHSYRITNFGESHGSSIGIIIDGCPAGILIDHELIKYNLNRRRPGGSKIKSTRNEQDTYEILSGILNGRTTGAPIAFLIRNRDQNPKDYSKLKDIFRPSHADYVYYIKYGIRDHRGGGRSSARMTASNVIAGSIAQMLLKNYGEIKIIAYTKRIGRIELNKPIRNLELRKDNEVVCPDPMTASRMINEILEASEEGDSLGGIIECIIKNVPVGLGEPLYHKLDAMLASHMMGINGAKAFEVGSGMQGTSMKGSEHNDEWYFDNQSNTHKTRSNFSGGIQGGISNGEDIVFRVGFKPVASIKKTQKTSNTKGHNVSLNIEGRHDPCVVPRAIPIVEAHAAIVLADFMLQFRNSKI